jgi:hypothetical protein
MAVIWFLCNASDCTSQKSDQEIQAGHVGQIYLKIVRAQSETDRSVRELPMVTNLYPIVTDVLPMVTWSPGAGTGGYFCQQILYLKNQTYAKEKKNTAEI